MRIVLVLIWALSGCHSPAGSPNRPVAPAAAAPASVRELWTWLAAHAERLGGLEAVEVVQDDGLRRALALVDPGLVAEVTTRAKGADRDLIISADGQVSLFPLVDQIVDGAPELPGWRLVAFRPRSPNPAGVYTDFAGYQLEAAAISFEAKRGDGRVAVTLFVPGWTGAETSPYLGQAALILLGTVVGERDAAQYISAVEIQAPPARRRETIHPLPELRDLIDDLKDR